MKDLNEYASKIASNFTHLDESRLQWMWDAGSNMAKLGWKKIEDIVQGIKDGKKLDQTPDPKLLTYQPSSSSVPAKLVNPNSSKIVGLNKKGKLAAGAATAAAIAASQMLDDDPSDNKEPGQRKEDEMREALKKQAADALNKKPGEQHPGVGDAPNAESPKPEKAPKKETSSTSQPTNSSDYPLTWSGYTAQKIATKGQGARQDLARKTQSAAWDAAQNKKLSNAERTKAAFLAKRLQDKEYRGGR